MSLTSSSLNFYSSGVDINAGLTTSNDTITFNSSGTNAGVNIKNALSYQMVDTDATPGTITFSPPSVVSTNYTLTFPNAPPADNGYILVSSSSGVLTWTPPVSIFSWKNPVTVATTADIALSGEQTIDGVSVVAGDIVLVKNQSIGTQNGIYTASAGAWARIPELPVGASAGGVAVISMEGTIGADTAWACTNDPPADIVGTDSLVFAAFASSTPAAGNSNEIQFNDPTLPGTFSAASISYPTTQFKYDTTGTGQGRLQVGGVSGTAPAFLIQGADGTTTGTDISVVSGNGSVTGGAVNITAGTGPSTSTGGLITMKMGVSDAATQGMVVTNSADASILKLLGGNGSTGLNSTLQVMGGINTIGNLSFLGSSTGYTTLTTANSSATDYVLTLPATTAGLVVGPASNTSNAIPRFSGTSGQVIQDNPTLLYVSPQLTLASSGSTMRLRGGSTGYTTLSSANASSTSYVATLPAATGTIVLGSASSTTNALASYTDTTGGFIKSNANITFSSPTLTLGGTSATIVMTGSSTGTNTLAIANASGTSYVNTLPAITGTLALVPAVTNSFNDVSMTVAGTAATTNRMCGFGGSWKITPTAYGIVKLLFTGFTTQTSSANTSVYQIRYGTGTAPVNNAAVTGTTVGPLVAVTNTSNPVNSKIPFSVGTVIRGLTVGTAYWFDFGYNSSTNTGSFSTNGNVIAEELLN